MPDGLIIAKPRTLWPHQTIIKIWQRGRIQEWEGGHKKFRAYFPWLRSRGLTFIWARGVGFKGGNTNLSRPQYKRPYQNPFMSHSVPQSHACWLMGQSAFISSSNFGKKMTSLTHASKGGGVDISWQEFCTISRPFVTKRLDKRGNSDKRGQILVIRRFLGQSVLNTDLIQFILSTIAIKGFGADNSFTCVDKNHYPIFQSCRVHLEFTNERCT